MAVSYMTKDGYDKILAEINYLETVKRPEISAQIAEARDKGDLSENAEYDAAKEAQGIMEAKLSQLKGLISNARLIDETRVQTDEVLAPGALPARDEARREGHARGALGVRQVAHHGGRAGARRNERHHEPHGREQPVLR